MNSVARIGTNSPNNRAITPLFLFSDIFFPIAGRLSGFWLWVAEALPLLRRAEGPVLVVIKVRAEDTPLFLPPKDGVLLKDRFRAALLGAGAAG